MNPITRYETIAMSGNYQDGSMFISAFTSAVSAGTKNLVEQHSMASVEDMGSQYNC